MKIKLKIMLLLCMLLYTCTVCGCGNKEALTVDIFYSTMDEKGFELFDVTEHVKADYVETISLAVAEDYQIEFYVFTDTESSASVWEQNRSVFEEKSGTNGIRVTKNLSNYSFFSIQEDGVYRLVARIDNTMLYVVADDVHKEEIVELVKELGY